MSEKKQVSVDIKELSEYDRFLLEALLQQATREARKPLSADARHQLILTFFEERHQAKRGQMNAKGLATKSRKQRKTREQATPDFQWRPPEKKRRPTR